MSCIAEPLGGFAPKPPGFTAFFPPEWMSLVCFQGAGSTCPSPFRPLNRSLELLPSSALSRPVQVIPEWTTPTSPCNTFSANGDSPLNFVSHSRGSLHLGVITSHGPSRESSR